MAREMCHRMSPAIRPGGARALLDAMVEADPGIAEIREKLDEPGNRSGDRAGEAATNLVPLVPRSPTARRRGRNRRFPSDWKQGLLRVRVAKRAIFAASAFDGLTKVCS